jgi:5-methylcytosine-specific restriction enzyme subunit McrC
MEPLLVFEHTKLTIDDKFKRRHWQALADYNELHDNKYFTVLGDGIRFSQYVGVLQVEELQIEILPKVGRYGGSETEKRLWQGVLIDMLEECHWLQHDISERTMLSFTPGSLLEAYIAIFLNDCESLIRRGLIRRYRRVEANSTSLKGKLLFNQHLAKNLIHAERFYTSHQQYDHNHLICQLLFAALKKLHRYELHPSLVDKLNELIFSFPEVSDVPVTTRTAEKLVFDRKSEPYRQTVQIALMLLLDYRPELSTGNNSIFALMFDMNLLWEEYITHQLVKALPRGWRIKPQDETRFWRMGKTTKSLRPDIVLQTQNNKFIMDTKWKMPEDNVPSDHDLRQIFAYCHGWNAVCGILLYPANQLMRQDFLNGEFLFDPNYRTSIGRISVLDGNQSALNRNIGNDLIRKLVHLEQALIGKEINDVLDRNRRLPN